MFPAARIGDMHVCPMVTPGVPPIPHVGGPITVGNPTVLVGGVPAARLSDMATCVGPPDMIAKGAATVLMGGLPAARLMDNTVHGGMVVVGMPTVLIGDPAFGLPPNFTVQGSPAFQAKVIRDLYYLSTLPSGQQLLSRLEASGQQIVIKEHTGTNGYCSPKRSTDAHAGTPTGAIL